MAMKRATFTEPSENQDSNVLQPPREQQETFMELILSWTSSHIKGRDPRSHWLLDPSGHPRGAQPQAIVKRLLWCLPPSPAPLKPKLQASGPV